MGYEEYFTWKDETAALVLRLQAKGLSLDQLIKHPYGYIYGQWQDKKYLQKGFATPPVKSSFTVQAWIPCLYSWRMAGMKPMATF